MSGDMGQAALLGELRAKARAVGEATSARLEGLGEDDAARTALGALAVAGLARWTIPQRDGGAEARGLCATDDVSARAVCTLRDELAWHSAMLDVMLVMQGLCGYSVVRGGSVELRAEVLPALANGTKIGAFALTEPGAGSSVDDVATRAERAGAGWRITGHKTFISNAGIADHYSVLARTSGEPGARGGLTMFSVPAKSKGLTTERFEVIGPHPIGDVHFADVEVADGRRLGEVGHGQDLALATLGRFRTSVAACANGLARRALDETKAHLAGRKQFGRPLAAFQALRFDVAEMDVRLRAAQLLTDEAARAVDSGAPATAEVARAKLFATEAAGWICDRAVQLHGGLGVKRGSVVERLYRDVRALRIYEGTSEIQKLVLARELLG
ncbi:MAG: acyl-CoA dehydrogenase [Planctomycetota bacterium]|nr:acyl-CoA dehydrogenase [Planctomycetota bacterium]